MAKIIKIYKNGVEYKLGGGTASNPNQVPEGYVQLMGCNSGVGNSNTSSISDNVSIYSDVTVIPHDWGVNYDYKEEDKIDFLYSDIDDFNTFYIYVKTEDVDRIRFIQCSYQLTKFYQKVKLKSIYNCGNYLIGFDNVDVSEFVLSPLAFTKVVDRYKHIEDIVVGDTTNFYNMFNSFNIYNADYNTIYDLDLTKWDVSNVTNIERMFEYFGRNQGNTYFNLDLSTWDISKITNMSNMFNESNIKVLKIDNFDMSNVENYSSMFASTNFTNIYCKQAFRDWCIEHKDEIGLYDNFINRLVGSYKYPDLYTWCIVDWTGEEPVLKNLFKTETVGGQAQIGIYYSNTFDAEFYNDADEYDIKLYDVKLEKLNYILFNGNQSYLVLKNDEEFAGKFIFSEFIGIDSSKAQITVTPYQNEWLFRYCSGIRNIWDLSGFTFNFTEDNKKLFYSCRMKSLKLPQSLGEFNTNGLTVADYVICSSAALPSLINSLGTRWVGPVDSDCYYRLYDYDENESYNGFNINLKDANEWDDQKMVHFKAYDKNGMLIPENTPISIQFMTTYTDADGNEQQNGWYGINLSSAYNVYGYGTTRIILNNYVNHNAIGQINFKDNTAPTFTLDSSSPVLGEPFRIDLDWEYVEYINKTIYITANALDEDGNSIDASLLNKLNIIAAIDIYGGFNFNNTIQISTYNNDISFNFYAQNQNTGQSTTQQIFTDSALQENNSIELNITIPASWIDTTEKVACKIFADGQVLLYDGSNQRTVDLSLEGTEITGSLVAPVGIWKFIGTTRLENIEVLESNMVQVVASQDNVLNGMFENCPDLEYVYIGFSQPTQGYYARNAFNGKSKLKVCDCGPNIGFNGYYKNNMFLDTALETIKCGYNAFSDFIQGQDDEAMMPWAEGSKTKYFAGPIGSGANYELYDWESRKNNIDEANWYTNMVDVNTFECTDISLTSNEVTVSAGATSLNVNVICTGTVQKINSEERIDFTKTEVVTVEFEANETAEEKSFLKDVTIYGKTVQILITQRAKGASSWDIDFMDGEFRVAETGTNPDPTKFDMYESCGHTGQDNTQDQMNITIVGYDTFRVYVKNYSEQNFDYIRVRGNDGSEIYSAKSESDYNNDDWNKWKEIVVDCSGVDEYTLKFEYIKDSSSSQNNDRGYVLVPKDQSYTLGDNQGTGGDIVEDGQWFTEENMYANMCFVNAMPDNAQKFGVEQYPNQTGGEIGIMMEEGVDYYICSENRNHYVTGRIEDVNGVHVVGVCGNEYGSDRYTLDSNGRKLIGTNKQANKVLKFNITGQALASPFKLIVYKEDTFQGSDENIWVK